MKRKAKHERIELDPEESEFLTSFENGEWKSAPNSKQEKKSAEKSALKTLRKDVRMQTSACQETTYQISNSELHMKVFPTKHSSPVFSTNMPLVTCVQFNIRGDV